MITTEKLTDKATFHAEWPSKVNNPGGWLKSNETADYDTAVAWAHQDGARVVMTRIMTFVCEADPSDERNPS